MGLMSEDEFLTRASCVPLHALQWSVAHQKGVEVFIRRDDLLGTYLSGNKFYKLFYNLLAAQSNGQRQLLTYGGAYSNHIYALAAAANLYGFTSIGVIRGERPEALSPTLRDAEAWGMKLHFVSRVDYSNRCSAELSHALQISYGDFFEIPEGGANLYGLEGTRVLGESIYRQVKSDYTSVCLACGTGNTLAGVAAGLAKPTGESISRPSVVGFSVLKGDGKNAVSVGMDVLAHQQTIENETSNWRLISGFHCGGYAKKLPDYLHRFMVEFERETEVMLDPVYTLKMCWGVKQLLLKNYWPRGSRIILIHTGGLQGRRGFNL